jgi:hypothetical protein
VQAALPCPIDGRNHQGWADTAAAPLTRATAMPISP